MIDFFYPYGWPVHTSIGLAVQTMYFGGDHKRLILMMSMHGELN